MPKHGFDDENEDKSGTSGSANAAKNSGGKQKAEKSYGRWELAYERMFNILSDKQIPNVDQGFATTESGEVLKQGETLKKTGPKQDGLKGNPKPRPRGFGGSSSSVDENEDDTV